MNFQYFLPVNLIFGRGKAELLGSQTAAWGKKALVVTGTGSTKRSGLLDRALGLLKDAGVEAAVFDKATQNPLTTTVEEGAALCRQLGCDVVVALGGGSIMDCAKGVAFMAVNDGDVNDYIFNRKTGDKALPLILVPTTCGTGSEGNGFAVMTNPENGDKKSLRTSAVIAKASIIDSELMETMPVSVLAAVGFDALCHCMEAYTSRAAQPLTDIMSLKGIELAAKSLTALVQGTGTPEDWDAMTLASTLGGMVINNAGVTLAHGMEHPASGLKNLVHGRGLAALTPVIIERSYTGDEKKFGDISRLLGGTCAADCADAVRRFLAAIGLNITLGEQGITEEDIPWMTENFFKVSPGSLTNNPVSFDKAGIAEIYKAAL